MKLLGRIIVEKRAVLLPIALLAVANIAAYAFVLYPLQSRVATAETRTMEAERVRRAAANELANARATQVGKQQAEEGLQKFYHQVLPANLADARTVAYLRLAQLARQSNLRLQRQIAEEAHDQRASVLTHLKLDLVLEGSYEDIRRFIYAVETAPEFLIIDTMGLALRNEPNAPLTLTLGVSTYFWTGANNAT